MYFARERKKREKMLYCDRKNERGRKKRKRRRRRQKELAWRQNGRWNSHEIYSRRISREWHAELYIREFRYSIFTRTMIIPRAVTLSVNFMLWQDLDRFPYSDSDNTTYRDKTSAPLRATSEGRRLILFPIVQYHL